MARVDMLERLPAPYGLVRYGVAPDHPRRKEPILVYQTIARMPGFNLLANVTVGRDVSIEELCARYHAVVFTCGAQTDRRLGIPGEELPSGHAAFAFVAWYNGHPEYRDRASHLSQGVVAIIGQGNVATDLCRMLGSIKTVSAPIHAFGSAIGAQAQPSAAGVPARSAVACNARRIAELIHPSVFLNGPPPSRVRNTTFDPPRWAIATEVSNVASYADSRITLANASRQPSLRRKPGARKLSPHSDAHRPMTPTWSPACATRSLSVGSTGARHPGRQQRRATSKNASNGTVVTTGARFLFDHPAITPDQRYPGRGILRFRT